MGEVGSEKSVLVSKPLGNKQVEEPCGNGNIILKCNLSWGYYAYWRRQDSFDVPLLGSRDHCNKSSDSTRGGDFLTSFSTISL